MCTIVQGQNLPQTEDNEDSKEKWKGIVQGCGGK